MTNVSCFPLGGMTQRRGNSATPGKREAPDEVIVVVDVVVVVVVVVVLHKLLRYGRILNPTPPPYAA